MPARFPPPSSLARRPLTTGLGVAAIATTVLWESGVSIEALTMAPEALGTEPWRLFTSALPHVGLVHLVFNVYWLAILGGAIEERCGARATAALLLLTAAGSASLEHALFSGGVGLSGIGYGLFGFTWVAARRRVAFEDVMDRATAWAFIAWFVICCVTTWTGVFVVGNAAHAGGCALGMLAGLAWSHPARRWLASAATLAATALCLVLASAPVRAIVNVRGLAQDLADEGYAALDEDPARAAQLYGEALARDESVANWHYNRGVALDRIGENADADQAYARALEIAPSDPDYLEAVASSHVRRGNAAMMAGRFVEAAHELRQAVALVPDHEMAVSWRAAVLDLDAREAVGPPPGAPPAAIDDDIPF